MALTCTARIHKVNVQSNTETLNSLGKHVQQHRDTEITKTGPKRIRVRVIHMPDNLHATLFTSVDTFCYGQGWFSGKSGHIHVQGLGEGGVLKTYSRNLSVDLKKI
jgi:hypothetical protein